eukprot:g500.t1
MVENKLRSIPASENGSMEIALDFKDERIGDDGVLLLSHLFMRNQNINTLCLHNCGLTSLGAIDLAKSIRFNTVLSTIDLSSNGLTSVGVSEVCRRIVENLKTSFIGTLNLANTEADDHNARTIAHMLLLSSNIVNINLSKNPKITSEGLKCISMALQVNDRILELEVDGLEKEKEPFLQRNRIISEILDDIIGNSLSIEAALKMRTEKPTLSSDLSLTDAEFWNDSETSLPKGASIMNRRISFAQAERIGRRQSMEDVVSMIANFGHKNGSNLFAVFDGHGGAECSRFVGKQFAHTLHSQLKKQDTTEKAIFQTFSDLNDMCHTFSIPNGTCCLVCYTEGNKLYCASAGDSMACLGRKKEDGTYDAIQLGRVWKPKDPEEKKRIKDLDGFVTDNGRVGGVLAVSRALGDIEIQPYVSWEPSIDCTDLCNEDELIILGCDGLWDMFTYQEAVDLVQNVRSPWRASRILRDAAYDKGSMDNISVIVVRIESVSK